MFQMHTLSNRLSLHLAANYKAKAGLSPAEWRALAVIGRYGPLSAKEIARETVMDVFRITRAIGQIDKKGLITRKIDPEDRRKISVELTKKGRKVIDKIMPDVLESTEKLQAVLTEKEKQTLADLMGKLERHSIELFGAVPGSDNRAE